MGNTPDFTAYGYKIIEELGNYYYEDYAVYLGWDETHNRLVVLKQYRFGFAVDETEITPVVRYERDTLLALDHPGIPKCLDYLVVRDAHTPHVGSIILVLEHKPGTSLEKEFHLTLEQLQSLVLQVLDILAYGQTLSLFHYGLNEGDIMLDYLPQGQIQVAVLNFGKRRDTAVMPKPAEKWRHDLKKFGAIVVRLLSGKVTSDLPLFQKHAASLSRLVSARFQGCVRRLLAETEEESFQDARQARQQFEKIPVISPVHPPRHIPFPTLLVYFAISVLLCGVWFGWAELSAWIQAVGKTMTVGFIPGLRDVVSLVAGGLFGIGALLAIVFLCHFILEGVIFGLFLIVLAALVLGLYWLIGFMVTMVMVLSPIAIAGILLVVFYSVMAACWVQMRRQKFTASYTVLTMLSGILVAIPVTGTARSLLVLHQNSTLFMLLIVTTLPLWVYLLTYPASRYKADVARHQKAQEVVLKA